MLRITHSGYTRLRTMDLEGKLVGAWVDELRVAVGAAHAGDCLCLNLQRLAFADSAGLALLHELHRDGAQLAGASPLIEALLAMHAQTPCMSTSRSVPA